MYAVIETGGKQYKVAEGDVIFVEKMGAEEGAEVKFDKVILVGDENGVKVGAPVVDGAVVNGKVLRNAKGKKIYVMTYKPKKNEKRKRAVNLFLSKADTVNEVVLLIDKRRNKLG